MNQVIGHRNQIEFFVRFKADRSLKCCLPLKHARLV